MEYKVSIDVGLRNFAIATSSPRNVFLIDFVSESIYYNQLSFVLSEIFKIYTNNCPINILVESQVNLSRGSNRNIRYEYFLYGILKAMPLNIRIFRVNSKIKKKIAETNFDWVYLKVNSKRKFVRFVQDQCPNLCTYLKTWQISCIKMPVYEFKLCNLENMKKYDDLIDAILMLESSGSLVKPL